MTASDLYDSHIKIRRDHVVLVGHLAVACNWAGNHSATPASLTTRQGGICMRDVAECAPTKGDLAVASHGAESNLVRLSGILPRRRFMGVPLGV